MTVAERAQGIKWMIRDGTETAQFTAMDGRGNRLEKFQNPFKLADMFSIRDIHIRSS